MKRFFGLMPSSEVKIEKRFKTKSDSYVTIQAGDHGWTIIYDDGSNNYANVDLPAEENFEVAYKIVTNKLGELEELI